jgi:type II secretory ATPase GspE/PulE/Tfp pilus assembly ATPase PilB-like protein
MTKSPTAVARRVTVVRILRVRYVGKGVMSDLLGLRVVPYGRTGAENMRPKSLDGNTFRPNRIIAKPGRYATGLSIGNIRPNPLLAMITTSNNESPEGAFVHRVLQEAMTQGASHVHVEPVDDDVAVRYRVGREYTEFSRETRDISAVMTRLRTLAGLSVVPPFGPEWGIIKFENGERVHRFGTQMLPSLTGEKAVLQLLRETYMDPRRLDELGMSHDQLAALKYTLEQRSGLILLCGPTGSGLDTTAYAALLRLDRSARSVATIEIVAQGQVPGVHRMEAGDIDEKNAMLRALIRTDTDVIYVQDLSGVESATLALSAVIEHQKLVIASFHSSSAATAVTHFVNMGIEPWLVGSGIRLIQAQRLIRRLCPECREHAVVLGAPTPNHGSEESAQESFASHRAVGCDACEGLGYLDDRILVCESMAFSHPLVREGMTTLRASALGIAREGETTLDEVYLHTPPD